MPHQLRCQFTLRLRVLQVLGFNVLYHTYLVFIIENIEPVYLAAPDMFNLRKMGALAVYI